MKLFLYILFVAAIFSKGNTAFGATESWYTYWGFGSGSVSYGGDAKIIADAAKTDGFDNASAFSGDLLGFYWPVLTPTTLMGVDYHYVSDNWELSGVGGSATLNMTMGQVSFSTMHFFGAEPGDGFFLRGDIGITNFRASVSVANLTFEGQTDSGFGVVLGGGYGLVVTEETRVLFSLIHAAQTAQDVKFNTTSLMIGGLW